MKKLNEKLFTVSVYALIVILFTVLFGITFFNIATILGFIKDITLIARRIFCISVYQCNDGTDILRRYMFTEPYAVFGNAKGEACGSHGCGVDFQTRRY